jgi:hypothetical protein
VLLVLVILGGLAFCIVAGVAGLAVVLAPLAVAKDWLDENGGARALVSFGSLLVLALAFISGVGWFEAVGVVLVLLMGFYWFCWIDDH